MSTIEVVFTFEQMERMAEAIAKSGLFGLKTKDQVLSLMLVAQSEGKHPATVAQEYNIINGKPARTTHSVLARYQESGGFVQFDEVTDKICRANFKHPAYPDKKGLDLTWTIEQAQAIQVWNPDLKDGKGDWESLTNNMNWRNFPRAMLRSRTTAEGVRLTYPRAIGGAMTVEEAQDLGKSPNAPAPQANENKIEGPTPKVQTETATAKSSFASESSTVVTGEDSGASSAAVPVVEQATPKQNAQQSMAEPLNTTGTPEETGAIMKSNRVKIMRARMSAAGVTDEQITQKFGKPLDKLLMSQSAAIQAFIENPPGK